MSENVIPITRRSGGTKRRKPSPTNLQGAPLRALVDSWRIALESSNKSPRTIKVYTASARALIAWLHAGDRPTDAEGVTAGHIREFLLAELKRTKPASVASHHRNLHVLFNWIIEEDERTTPNPVRKTDAPKVPRKVKEYLTDDQIRRLLAQCTGKDFASRRNAALIRVLADNGARVSGMSNIRLDGVDLRNRTLKIVLKGGDELLAPIGAKAAAAIDKYLRVRARHPQASSPWLWLGVRGPGTDHLADTGVRRMLRDVGERAGVEGVHPHRFRGTIAHNLLKAGASRGDVQRILGWKSGAMVDYYTEDLSVERARETHARLSPGDRI